MINTNKLDESFDKTMNLVRNDLSSSSRVLSKVIHNKSIEIASDIVGGTLVRSNAVLFGAFSAFALTLASYIIAKSIGYPLSGSETILTFTLGWLIGLLFDYLRALATGKS